MDFFHMAVVASLPLWLSEAVLVTFLLFSPISLGMNLHILRANSKAFCTVFAKGRELGRCAKFKQCGETDPIEKGAGMKCPILEAAWAEEVRRRPCSEKPYFQASLLNPHCLVNISPPAQ